MSGDQRENPGKKRIKFYLKSKRMDDGGSVNEGKSKKNYQKESGAEHTWQPKTKTSVAGFLKTCFKEEHIRSNILYVFYAFHGMLLNVCVDASNRSASFPEAPS